MLKTDMGFIILAAGPSKFLFWNKKKLAG